MEIEINVDTTDFDQTMQLTLENLNYFELYRAFKRAGLDKPVLPELPRSVDWHLWSHYLWEGDWNSQRPKPKLTMHRWDPFEETWVKVDGVESVEIKEN